jgi:hypothetical protein
MLGEAVVEIVERELPQGPEQPYWLEGRTRVPLRLAVAALLEEWTIPSSLTLQDEPEDDFCGWERSSKPAGDSGGAAADVAGSGRRSTAGRQSKFASPLSRAEEDARARQEVEALLKRCVREGACSSVQAGVLAQQLEQGLSSLNEVMQQCNDLLSVAPGRQ